MRFIALLGLVLGLFSALEPAFAKTYVYTCTTAVVDRWGRERPGTRYEAYYRANDGDRVGILANNFCPDALNQCVNGRAGWGECCDVVGAGALGGDYTSQVRWRMGSWSRQCRNGGGGGGSQSGVFLYSDNGFCSQRNFIAAIGPTTNCNSLYNAPWVRGIDGNGRCQDIPDMDPVQACERYKYM